MASEVFKITTKYLKVDYKRNENSLEVSYKDIIYFKTNEASKYRNAVSDAAKDRKFVAGCLAGGIAVATVGITTHLLKSIWSLRACPIGRKCVLFEIEIPQSAVESLERLLDFGVIKDELNDTFENIDRFWKEIEGFSLTRGNLKEVKVSSIALFDGTDEEVNAAVKNTEVELTEETWQNSRKIRYEVVGENNVVFTWDPVPTAGRYKLNIENKASGEETECDWTKDTKYTANLTVGETYKVNLTIFGIDESEIYQTEKQTCIIESPPQLEGKEVNAAVENIEVELTEETWQNSRKIRYEVVGENNVVFTWDPVPTAGRYKLNIENKASGRKTECDWTKDTKYTANLAVGETYEVNLTISEIDQLKTYQTEKQTCIIGDHPPHFPTSVQVKCYKQHGWKLSAVVFFDDLQDADEYIITVLSIETGGERHVSSSECIGIIKDLDANDCFVISVQAIKHGRRSKKVFFKDTFQTTEFQQSIRRSTIYQTITSDSGVAVLESP